MNRISDISPNVLVRNALYWSLYEGDILAYDLERQSLDVIEKLEQNHAYY
jgi:hypothetical protein